MAQLVDHETPVGVAVEGQSDVGAGLQHVRLQVDEVRRVQRIGLMVGERAVEFEEQRSERDRRNRSQHSGSGVAGHAVARIDGDLQRPQLGQADQRSQELAVVGQNIAFGHRAARPVVARHPGDDFLADRGEARVLADGLGAGPTQLDAVVGGRVVAGGEHRAGTVQQTRREIQLIGGGKADANHVEALRDHALGEGVRQRRRAVAHVVADHDPRRVLITHEAGECAADLGDELFVEFLADQAAHVIRLDDTVDSRGGPGHRTP